MTDKICRGHKERRAIVYLRQSTLKQVYEHRESTDRQYGLQARAIALGWREEQVEVFDEDLGQSGSSTERRSGFKRLAGLIAQGQVGAVFALEVSRLSRSSADWHRLLELCGLADVVIIDEQSVYTPRDYNDRLLLGLKGQMSETEQYWMRLRMEGGRLNKARRGELYFRPPAGYQWDRTRCRFLFDPDEHVQAAIRLVFERFCIEKSAYGVTRYFSRHQLLLPARRAEGLVWGPARTSHILRMLHNPVYAGAYVFGRHEERKALVNGEIKIRHKTRMPKDEWKSFLPNHHPAYIDWDEYMENQEILRKNRTRDPSADRKGAAREGNALLQGVAMCGSCGRRMMVRYRGRSSKADYHCAGRAKDGCGGCFSVMAQAIDSSVTQLLLQALQPAEIELGLAVYRETERQMTEISRQWQLRLERARYDARLAERRYKAVDPDNRVIARTLEREWEEALLAIETLERQEAEVAQREQLVVDNKQRARMMALAQDVKAVWNAASTTEAERKNLLRMLITDVALRPVEVPKPMIRIQVRWKTGAIDDFTVPRLNQGRKTSAEIVALVQALFNDGKNDAQICQELHRRGLKTGVGAQWTVPAVQRVRYSQGFVKSPSQGRRCVSQRDDGCYSIHGIAKRFDVRPAVVRYWVQKGLLLPVEGGGTGKTQWFVLDEQTVARIEAAKANHHPANQTSNASA